MERFGSRNWIVRYYDLKNKLVGEHKIIDKTEYEAEKEAIKVMPKECDNWWDMKPIS